MKSCKTNLVLITLLMLSSIDGKLHRTKGIRKTEFKKRSDVEVERGKQEVRNKYRYVASFSCRYMIKKVR